MSELCGSFVALCETQTPVCIPQSYTEKIQSLTETNLHLYDPSGSILCIILIYLYEKKHELIR